MSMHKSEVKRLLVNLRPGSSRRSKSRLYTGLVGFKPGLESQAQGLSTVRRFTRGQGIHEAVLLEG